MEQGPALSPDGRWLAYSSNEMGRGEVHVRPFPDVNSGRWQVSVNGGHWPIWNQKGDRLYYIHSETLMEVEVSTNPSLRLGQPREVFTREPLGWSLRFGWPPGFDVSADEEKFVLCQAKNQDQKPQVIVVVENWLREFEETK